MKSSLYNGVTKLQGGFFISNKNSISYRQVGDFLIPNLILPSEDTNITLGKWGMMHKDYLEKYTKAQFNTLLMQGKLYQHCAEFENQARDMFDTLIEQMREVEGVTEQLKEHNQLEWVQRMVSMNHNVYKTSPYFQPLFYEKWANA